MFSSPPPPKDDHRPLPLTVSNIQLLDIRTQRDLERYLKEYAVAQARNRGVFAAQGERERKTWKEESQAYQTENSMKHSHVAGMESPLLKARVHLRENERAKEKSRGGGEDRESIQIKKEMKEPNEAEEETRNRTNKIRENGTRRKRGKDDEDVREANERNERLAQRRARRQAKEEILSGPASKKMVPSNNHKQSRKRERNEEEAIDDDSERDTRKKKKRKREVALGIALMEKFTTKNVAHGRLTLPPPSHAGLFNKGRASAKTEFRKGGKENQRPSNFFSEFEFLNQHNTLRGQYDGCSSSSSRSSETSSIPSLSQIRRQAGKRGNRPNERKKPEASFPRKKPKRRDTRTSPPPRPGTNSRQHSVSWGVGSVLPSDAESVRAAPTLPCPQTLEPTGTVEGATDRGTSPAPPSRQPSPEVVIMALPSKWIFDEAGDAEGRFRLRYPAEQTTPHDIQASSKEEPHSHNITTFQSRFFPAPVQSPLQIPGTNESLRQPSADRPMAQTDFSTSLHDEPHREAFEAAVDEPSYIGHGSVSDDYTPPEAYMTKEWSEAGSVYQQNPGLTVAHFIDEHLGPDAYLDGHTDVLLDIPWDVDTSLGNQRLREPVAEQDPQQEASGLAPQWDGEHNECFNELGVGSTVWRDATTMSYENTGIEASPYDPFPEQSQDHNEAAYDVRLHHGGFTSAGVDREAYHRVESPRVLPEEQPRKEGLYEGSIEPDVQASEEEEVMLEFSKGRALLMGMGQGILAEEPMRHETRGLHPKPYRLQFGQSVGEIEVMVGKNLANLWKQ